MSIAREPEYSGAMGFLFEFKPGKKWKELFENEIVFAVIPFFSGALHACFKLTAG